MRSDDALMSLMVSLT